LNFLVSIFFSGSEARQGKRKEMPPNYSFSLSKEMTENGIVLSFFFTGFEMKGFFFLFSFFFLIQMIFF
jgi:hypothetical protein